MATSDVNTKQRFALSPIPEWFSYKDYLPARKIRTAKEWADQLWVRHKLYEGLRSEVLRAEVESKRITTQADLGALAYFQRLSGRDRKGRSMIHPPHGYPIEARRSLDGHDGLTVGSLTRKGVIALANLLPEEDLRTYRQQQQLYKRWGQRIEGEKYSDPSILSLSVDELLLTDISRSDRNLRHLIVNLESPDAVLKEKFSEWLLLQRKASRPTKPLKEIDKADMRKWADHRVLPYADLVIWALHKRVRFQDAKVARAIFEDKQDINVRQKLINCTKPAFDLAMSATTIRSLIAQAG